MSTEPVSPFGSVARRQLSSPLEFTLVDELMTAAAVTPLPVTIATLPRYRNAPRP